MVEMTVIENSAYGYSPALDEKLAEISARIENMRSDGALKPADLKRIREHFKIKNIYNSNAIEGNRLSLGETRLVVRDGLTISGKSLRDVAEAKNLGEAVDYLEELVQDGEAPIRERDIRDVHALILRGIDDAGAGDYRTKPVAISGSDHTPPSPEAVPAEMREFGEWLSGLDLSLPRVGRPDAIPLAAAAHMRLASIHPFIDGNGRTARILMNLVLMRVGYPIAIITKDDRNRYYDALENSHEANDLSAFVALVMESVSEGLEEYERAVQEKRERQDWAAEIGAGFGRPMETKVRAEYELWRYAMNLLKSYFFDAAETINATTPYAEIFCRDFGEIEFEKYFALRGGHSAKKTWFFRIDVRSDEKTARVLFFFGFASPGMERRDATLLIAIETPPGSFYYERASETEMGAVLGMTELAYDAEHEKFNVLDSSGDIRPMGFEETARTFYGNMKSLF